MGEKERLSDTHALCELCEVCEVTVMTLCTWGEREKFIAVFREFCSQVSRLCVWLRVTHALFGGDTLNYADFFMSVFSALAQ